MKNGVEIMVRVLEGDTPKKLPPYSLKFPKQEKIMTGC